MKNVLLFFSFLLLQTSFSQESLKRVLKKYNSESVPYISVTDLKKDQENVVLLDTREPQEFNVSHLKNALIVGYDHFNLTKTLQKLPKDKSSKIVVYCSLGIRSEDIGEQLLKAGYTNVYNLYGGIFEWKNNGYSLINNQKKTTEKVHAFNKEWGKWLTKGIKVYE
ncbi:rhodanese-like domain-containing protein [Tenacibaculum amylolyticum]|uniref:rhodanese-like domain-containing protein n=1 Tax=Tenacibaculum amylolyticum TaxID=104269 RepID=UPI003894A031